MPCPLPESGVKEESVSMRTALPELEQPVRPFGDRRTYLSTSLTREDILGVDRAVQVVVHDHDDNNAKQMPTGVSRVVKS